MCAARSLILRSSKQELPRPLFHCLKNSSGLETDESTIQPPETKRKLELKLKRITTNKEKNRKPETKVCHPKEFEPNLQGQKTGKKEWQNPYAKETFLIWSSDSDFVSEKHKTIVFLIVCCVMMLYVFLCRSVC